MGKNVLIMEAAGRDFQNFKMLFKDRSQSRVMGLTVTQIPLIAPRLFSRKSAASLYPAGIPIFPGADLEKLILTGRDQGKASRGKDRLEVSAGFNRLIGN
jgi:predicted GTPase